MVKLRVTPGRWLLPALLVVTWLSRVAADGAKHSTPGKLNVIRPGTALTCVMRPQTSALSDGEVATSGSEGAMVPGSLSSQGTEVRH